MTRSDWRRRLAPVVGGEVQYKTWTAAVDDGVRSRFGVVMFQFARSVDEPNAIYHTSRVPFSCS